MANMTDGSAATAATEGTEVTTTTDEQVTLGGDALFGFLPEGTNVAQVPIPDPELHLGRIDAVTIRETDSYAIVSVAYTSIHEGINDELAFFLPLQFVQNIGVDAETLPKSDVWAEDDFGKYKSGVANNKGNATFQVLSQIAAKAGRPVARPTDFSSLIANFNESLSGVEALFSRSADKKPKNPQYADRLRTRNVYDASNATNPKFIASMQKRGYRITFL